MRTFLLILKWVAGAVGVLIVAVLTTWLMRGTGETHMRLFIGCGLTLIALLWSALILLRQWHHWQNPTHMLAELLEGARSGEVPIEELSKVTGGLSPVIPVIQHLLRDLRTEKMQVASLLEEMRQRVASRTDALERQLGSMRVAATRDALTGLYNRRMLDSTFQGLVSHCVNDGNDLSVLMIDVDYFKQLNDTQGHAAGDEFLKSLGQIIRSTIRGSDLAFRCGGDEFVIIMPGASRAGAQQMADRLGALTAQLANTIHAKNKPALSIGIACLSEVGFRQADQMLTRADEALYSVKSKRKSLRVA